MVDLQDIGTLMPYDGYLKLYQLSEPNSSQCFDCMLLDEGQDISPVIADIIHWQRIKTAIVGDPHQQFYRFRDTEDALSSDWMVGTEEHYLTQSWRFGSVIAHVASIILSYKDETRKLQGPGPQTLVKKSLPADLPYRAFIHCTATGIIENALQRVHNNLAPKFYWVDGIDSYSLRDPENLYTFGRGLRQSVQNEKLLRDYRDYTQHMEIAEIDQDSEMLRSIKVTSTYPDLLVRVLEPRSLTLDGELDAAITLTIAHRAKELERDFVCLYDDFNTDPLAPDIGPGKRDDELNLIYTAMTHTMKVLAINSLVLSIMQRYVDERKLEELVISNGE